MTKYPTLLSPLKMGSLQLPNRVVMAPLTRGRSKPDYTANELNVKYYEQRATAGLIISEGTHTSLMGRGWWQAPEVYTAAHAAAWRPVTAAVHAAGGRMFCQLWHTGRASHSNLRGGVDGPMGEKALPVAPSALKRASQSGQMKYTAEKSATIETPRALTLDEVRALPAEYANAAQTAKDAGFDGVEVHCANGYLLDTFLQSSTNVRDDEYGGPPEARFRIVDEVLRAVIAVFDGDASKVGVRISPNGSYNGMGAEDNATAFVYYAERLAAYGLAYLHVMIGTGFGFHNFGKPLVMADIRKVFPGILMANVGYDAQSAEDEIKRGDTDLVSFGRPYIANPDLVERFRVGAEIVESDPATWWTEVDNDLGEKGYTTYPPMSKV